MNQFDALLTGEGYTQQNNRAWKKELMTGLTIYVYNNNPNQDGEYINSVNIFTMQGEQLPSANQDASVSVNRSPKYTFLGILRSLEHTL